MAEKILQDRFSGLIKTSTIVKFPLELERDIGNSVTRSKYHSCTHSRLVLQIPKQKRRKKGKVIQFSVLMK
ncbi:hypothetical protein MTR_4g133850 [Medicago truncatula]|uniref:Uncharacterized protein n=1 Tax=Medicago truncatula TaxID=3880 RepID=G7JMW4_MEDTR|nr:hypothetical protein MTR_4g133850 [Medicago truncatula]